MNGGTMGMASELMQITVKVLYEKEFSYAFSKC
jgi:hypothetical protein